MTISGSNQNVGIGTSSPAKKFEVRGTDAAARFRGSNIQYLDITATSGGTVNLDANNGDFAVSVNNTERMRIDSSGNVGIGTSSPTIASGYTNLVVSDTDNGGILYVDRASGARGYFYANGTTSVVLGTVGSYPLTFTTADTERMRIDSSGNVGIGTTTPVADLEIKRTGAVNVRAQVTSAFESALWLVNGGGSEVSVINAGGSNIMSLRTDNTERMRISSGGDVLFNTTSFTGAGDTFRWSTGGMQLSRNANGDQIAFFTNSAFSGKISTSGTTTTYGTSSDYRLKENVAPMTGALDTVAQLKPVTYNWKYDGKAGQGFIAHELQAIVPDCVVGEKDAVDAEGKPDYQSIDTSFLVATLTAAIQEQQAMIETLKAKVEALENK
jgi:hypothetical protein